MSELAAKRGAVPAAKKVWFLVFRIGNERFALKATEVAEVLPRLALQPLAQAPVWGAGIFGQRG
ncbi:chemotaxis protein CheW, partial [Pseudomonas carnis]|uniref:chemotaxis protein CheW n=1 Tax=Pseudomonas carnis TaxID=2487355 RepID=UPI001F202E8A